MITTQLLRPESIVVVGASNNVHKTHTESKIYKMSQEYIGKLEG